MHMIVMRRDRRGRRGDAYARPLPRHTVCRRPRSLAFKALVLPLLPQEGARRYEHHVGPLSLDVTLHGRENVLERAHLAMGYISFQ